MTEPSQSSQPIQPASPAGTPPQAAETVASGKSERELNLERELAKTKAEAKATAEAKRKVEVEHAHLQDENHRLKQAITPPQPPAKPAAKKSWGFFEE